MPLIIEPPKPQPLRPPLGKPAEKPSRNVAPKIPLTGQCQLCTAPVPPERKRYCSAVCQKRESHRRWFAAHPGYKARKGREYRRKDRERINARRRERYQERRRAGQVLRVAAQQDRHAV